MNEKVFRTLEYNKIIDCSVSMPPVHLEESFANT